jgi:histidinol-phosphate aminotransferase
MEPFSIANLVRENIRRLVPYSSARDEFSGPARIFLDANENSLGSPLVKWYNRYPDPLQLKLKDAIGQIKGIDPIHLFLGNGSDECIDILYRAFCNPGVDNVIINPPTYGMYEVCAGINDIEVRPVRLTTDFQIDLQQVFDLVDARTKLIWICSPNNPTGNAIARADIEMLLNNFHGLVVIDEAYINFSRYRSFLQELPDYPNLVVLQTLSKAWGLAGLRLGMAFADPAIISVYNRVKPPYNVNQATQELALEALSHTEEVNAMIRHLVDMREELAKSLLTLGPVRKVFPSETNFLLVQIEDARAVYHYLLEKGIVVRDRSHVALCEGCLRITVGSESENRELITALKAVPSR